MGGGQQPRLVRDPPRPSACCRSREPITRSSVAPTGSSTSRAGRRTAVGVGMRTVRAGRVGIGRIAGEAAAAATTDWSGSTAASARTIVDLAVPFSPRTSTPPTSGEIEVRIRASAMSSEPTTAEKGNGTHDR